ncbi:MAG: exosporium glycoprotein BclB-related protein [Clostridia bacterium]
MSNIALQVEKIANDAVSNNASVLFDNILFANGNISYSPTLGEITINENGIYHVEWWVSQQSSSAAASVFGLMGVAGVRGSSPLKTGQTSGVAVFEVTNAPIVITLSNISGATVYFSNNTPVKASLIIVEDDEVSSGGAIIPFASGTLPIALTSIAGGLAGLPSFIAFGNSVQAPNILGLTIDLGLLSNMSFSVPRDGTITSIAAYFNVTIALDILLSSTTVRAELYQSTTPDNIFVPVPGSQINLAPSLSGVVAIGTHANGIIDNLSIPVTAETRLLMVFSITTTGINLLQTVTGHASAGITIV